MVKLGGDMPLSWVQGSMSQPYQGSQYPWELVISGKTSLWVPMTHQVMTRVSDEQLYASLGLAYRHAEGCLY